MTKIWTAILLATCGIVSSMTRSHASGLLQRPLPAAGASCTFGGFKSAPIGFPLGSSDEQGIHGNEIRQVYRLFYSFAEPAGAEKGVGFGGWLYSTFDGRYFYAPAVASAAPGSIGVGAIAVEPKEVAKLPLSFWLRTLISRQAAKPSREIASLMSVKVVSTALSRCFGENWTSRD